MQVFRIPAEDLRLLAADANYSWSNHRESCRSESARPLIKHKEHTSLEKAHNARVDHEHLPPALDEQDRLLATERRRRREALITELTRPVPRAHSQVHRP
jgi:IS5 family transposase